LELGPLISPATSKVVNLIRSKTAKKEIEKPSPSLQVSNPKGPGTPDLAFMSWNNEQLKNRLRYAGDEEKLRVLKELKRRGEGSYSGDISTLKAKKVASTEFPKVQGIKGYDAVKNFNAPGNKILGSGAQGEVKETDGHPPGVVKKGRIGQHEAEALKALKGTGVAPTLYGQAITGIPRRIDEGLGGHVNEASGYLGMSKVPGKSLSQTTGLSTQRPEDKQKLEEMANAFVSVRAAIHRKGVAHNDMHDGNFFYDPSNKRGHLVDFGLAQIGNRAALMEALGLGFGGRGGVTSSFDPSLGYAQKGDWQGDGIKGRLRTNLIQPAKFDRYMENRKRVLTVMEQDNPAAIKNYRDGGIRVDKPTLDKSGLTEKQAKTYIEMLYEGID
jgi:serine/threonine protein kinase